MDVSLPWSWYSDPEILRREQDRIFRRAWQYVGHTGQVPEAGCFAAARAGDVPVIVLRDREGDLRAFLNVCRHRGTLLVEGEGKRATIQCPYHAWTYDLDGSLRRAPRSEREPGFDGGSLGLRPVAVDTWGPLVFVNPDAAAPPLAETLGELPALVEGTGLDLAALAFHHRTESRYAANWKVCCENFLECYHCQVAHPGFSAVIDVSPEAYGLETSEWFSTQYAPVRANGRPAGFDPGDGELVRGQFHFLWPNVTINIAPGRPNLSVGPVLPDGPESTSRYLDYFFAPGEDAGWIEEMLAWDSQVGAEDTALVERVQRGVRAGVLEEGHLLSEAERLIGHFDALVTRALDPNRT